jgi:hypothetical protein
MKAISGVQISAVLIALFLMSSVYSEVVIGAVLPSDYQWHTFYGQLTTGGDGIAVDGSGNVYVTGFSGTTGWNGPNGQAPLHAYSGISNIFVMKLDKNGAYKWHTFYGAFDTENEDGINVNCIALDGSGNVYVTGTSVQAWNGPSGQAPLNAFSGTHSLFVLKLNSSGAYQWHTFYGSGRNGVAGNALALDKTGNVYITGYSDSSWGSPLHGLSGINMDIMVMKLNSSGAYQWHTYYGSTSDDKGSGIAVDDDGYVYVSGASDYKWEGMTALTPWPGSSTALVVLKLDSNGAYQWHTFYGSHSGTIGRNLALDGSGNIYVTGYTGYDDWNNVTAPLHGFVGDNNGVYVLKLTTGGAYLWHTFYSAETAEDRGFGIAAVAGGVYVTGWSSATWGAPTYPYTGENGDEEIFMLSLDKDGAYQWNAFFGTDNTSGDWGKSIALDSKGNVHVTGRSFDSTGWNVGSHSPRNYPASFGPVFILKLGNQSGTAPTVQTTSISAITSTAAVGGGNIVSDGGADISARGVCWSTMANPSTAGSHSTDGIGTGAFTSAIIGLTPNTLYYTRAYAVNSAGTGYGSDLTFTTNLCTSDVERGGKSYSTIQDAIDNGNGSEIRAVSRVFQDGLTFSNSGTVALSGGYGCAFGVITGYTTVDGSITIQGSTSASLGYVSIR